jgi:hypothetical protein
MFKFKKDVITSEDLFLYNLSSLGYTLENKDYSCEGYMYHLGSGKCC